MVLISRIIILVLVAMILVNFSGCIKEKKVTQIPESHEDAVIAATNQTPPSEKENEPEITITAFSSVYMRDNFDKKDRNVFTYNLSERYYAVYNLSIKNNGLNAVDFKLNDLHLRAGNEMFNTATLESYDPSMLEVLSDLEKESKIEDMTLYPNQTLSGDAVFRVDSLYNKSFVLIYDTKPITSPSFEKSLEALKKAENFNYSTALGMPPYSDCNERGGMTGYYEPKFDNNCDTWANWVNRSIFDVYQKSDKERMLKSPPNDIPLTEIIYALKVIPEKNLTMFPVTTRFLYYSQFLVIDDSGREITNKSQNDGIAVLSNQTYTFQPWWKLNIPGMNFTNGTVVQMSFGGFFGWPLATRFTLNNQDIILDDKLNIIVVRNSREHFVS